MTERETVKMLLRQKQIFTHWQRIYQEKLDNTNNALSSYNQELIENVQKEIINEDKNFVIC